MQVLLISTTDLKAARRDMLDRMLASMVVSAQELPQDRLTLAMLFQNCSESRLPALPRFAVGLAVEHRLSLSAARNRVLRRLAQDRSFDTDTVVAFPDDDCWYPPGFLRQGGGQ